MHSTQAGAVSTASEGRTTEGDGDLLDALRRRDPAAAEQLVVRYGARAHGLASRITGNASDAEEVVQDAFWDVIRKIDRFRGESAFGSWLYRIVANAAYDTLRGRTRRREDLALDAVLPRFDERGRHARTVVDWSPVVADPAMQAELRTALTSAIDELPAAYRVVLVLHDVEGWSNPEIARDLRVSNALVRTRTHRARLFIRKRLDEYLAPSGRRPPSAGPRDADPARRRGPGLVSLRPPMALRSHALRVTGVVASLDVRARAAPLTDSYRAARHETRARPSGGAEARVVADRAHRGAKGAAPPTAGTPRRCAGTPRRTFWRPASP